MKVRISKMPSLSINTNRDFLKNHPCFSENAHHRFGRIHLPVAPACNIQCKYCVRKYDCANESRPGITSRVLTPDEAMERVRSLVERNERLSVIGIAGPGDPLANNATFEVFRAINLEYPELTLCVSTNGLLLPDRLHELIATGVKSITVTVNAMTTETAKKIYSWAIYNGKRFTGKEAAGLISSKQWEGIEMATLAGLAVKINTVLIPGLNEDEIPMIAWLANRKDAVIQNILPLIPKGDLENIERPSLEAINEIRKKAGKFLPQMTHCKQCRADAYGELGEDKDMELEVLLAKIGEDYCERVM